MSVLETFYLAFKSDSKDVQKGAQDAKKSSDDLETSLLSNKKAADALGKSFLGSVVSAQKNISSLLSLGALTAKTLKEASQAEDLGRFAERLNKNVEEVATWSGAVTQMGGSAEGFRSTIEGLTHTLTEFSITGGGAAAETFARLGINAFTAGGQLKDAFTLLPEIADAFQGISDTEAANLGNKLGLDNATILLLQRGRGEIGALLQRQQQLGVVTKEDTEIATAFNMAWRDTSTLFGTVARAIGFTLLPILTDGQTILQDFIIYLRDNEEFLSQLFVTAGAVITAVYLPAIAGALTGTIAFLAPILLLAAVIGVLALAWNDLNEYLAGNDSLIGRLAERFPAVGKAAEGFANIVGNIKEKLEELFSSITTYFTGNVGKQFDRFLEFVGLKEEEGRPEPVQSVGGVAAQSDIPPIQQIDQEIASANKAMELAKQNPMLSASAAQITHSSMATNSQTTINIGDTNIQADNVDADSITSDLTDKLTEATEYVVSRIDTAMVI